MNALVSDQLSRLRRLLGDSDGNFLRIFREFCGRNSRRPQFGMYTGRTPYPGLKPELRADRELENTLAQFTPDSSTQNKAYYEQLNKAGRLPAKSDMKNFLEKLHDGIHIPDEEDAELLTRFEMQNFYPDILITNYSMLEYMLLRPTESEIWRDTRSWLQSDHANKILFVIDEAHMYRGSAGGETALLLRSVMRLRPVNGCTRISRLTGSSTRCFNPAGTTRCP